MNRIQTEIHAETVYELIQLEDRCVPVDVDLDYSVADPYAVRMTLAAAGSQPVTWRISRSLLADGLRTKQGEGDVRLIPLSPDSALLEMRSADGEAWFRIPSQEMKQFLQDSYQIAPANRESEWLDVDGGLNQLFGQEAGFDDANRRDS